MGILNLQLFGLYRNNKIYNTCRNLLLELEKIKLQKEQNDQHAKEKLQPKPKPKRYLTPKPDPNTPVERIPYNQQKAKEKYSALKSRIEAMDSRLKDILLPCLNMISGAFKKPLMALYEYKDLEKIVSFYEGTTNDSDLLKRVATAYSLLTSKDKKLR